MWTSCAHVCRFLVVVVVGDVAGEAEVGDLEDVIVGDQDVPGCQVSVNALQQTTIIGNSCAKINKQNISPFTNTPSVIL